MAELNNARREQAEAKAAKEETETTLNAHMNRWSRSRAPQLIKERNELAEADIVAEARLCKAQKQLEQAQFRHRLCHPILYPMHGRTTHGVIPSKDTVLIAKEHPDSTAALANSNVADQIWRKRSKTSYQKLRQRDLVGPSVPPLGPNLLDPRDATRLVYKKPLPSHLFATAVTPRTRWGYASHSHSNSFRDDMTPGGRSYTSSVATDSPCSTPIVEPSSEVVQAALRDACLHAQKEAEAVAQSALLAHQRARGDPTGPTGHDLDIDNQPRAKVVSPWLDRIRRAAIEAMAHSLIEVPEIWRQENQDQVTSTELKHPRDPVAPAADLPGPARAEYVPPSRRGR